MGWRVNNTLKEKDMKDNSIRKMWEEAAESKVVKPKYIPSYQDIYDMKHGPNGDQKATLDPEEQARRARRAQRKNSK